jgi:hypothetical protein
MTVTQVLDGPVTEVVRVPDTVGFDHSRAALRPKHRQRRVAGRSSGSVASTAFGNTSQSRVSAKVRPT